MTSTPSEPPSNSRSGGPRNAGCLPVAAGMLLGLGVFGALAVLLAMTYGMTPRGMVLAPLAIVSVLFLLIGLQYFVWRALGLVVRKAPPAGTTPDLPTRNTDV